MRNLVPHFKEKSYHEKLDILSEELYYLRNEVEYVKETLLKVIWILVPSEFTKN